MLEVAGGLHLLPKSFDWRGVLSNDRPPDSAGPITRGRVPPPAAISLATGDAKQPGQFVPLGQTGRLIWRRRPRAGEGAGQDLVYAEFRT